MIKFTKHENITNSNKILCIRHFQAAPYLATGRVLQGLHRKEGSYRKPGGARDLLGKERKGLFLGRDTFFESKKRGRVLTLWTTSSFCRAGVGPFKRLFHWY